MRRWPRPWLGARLDAAEAALRLQPLPVRVVGLRPRQGLRPRAGPWLSTRITTAPMTMTGNRGAVGTPAAEAKVVLQTTIWRWMNRLGQPMMTQICSWPSSSPERRLQLPLLSMRI